jgi:hypothetical protein
MVNEGLIRGIEAEEVNDRVQSTWMKRKNIARCGRPISRTSALRKLSCDYSGAFPQLMKVDNEAASSG